MCRLAAPRGNEKKNNRGRVGWPYRCARVSGHGQPSAAAARGMGPWYGAVDLCHNSAGRRPGRRARGIKNGAQHVCAPETLVVTISYVIIIIMIVCRAPPFYIIHTGPFRLRGKTVFRGGGSALSIGRRTHARHRRRAPPGPAETLMARSRGTRWALLDFSPKRTTRGGDGRRRTVST